jgi:membrane associated rhomboid family serine protease
MLFPISDDDRGISGPCWVTHAILLANILVFGWQYSHPDFTYGWSMIPAEITTGTDLVEPVLLKAQGQIIEIPQVPGPRPIYWTLLTSMFMHGGLGHIFGNMLYLWVFGDNVENRFGHFRFLLFYLTSGLAASAAQIAISPDGVIPNLGASGAIYGVLGAYIVLFPRNRVNAIFFYHVFSIPAYMVIGMWAVTQFMYGFGSIAMTEQTGGVAHMAHVGGFVAGVVVAGLVRLNMKSEPDSMLYRQYKRDDRVVRWW